MIVFAHPRLARLDGQDFLLAQAGWLGGGGGGGAVNLVEAMNDPDMLGPWFHCASWDASKAALQAAFALPMEVACLDSPLPKAFTAI
jgi:hypothetical protein